jgi:hypothetical protein
MTALPASFGSKSGSQRIGEHDDNAIMTKAVHTQHKDYNKFLQTVAPQTQHMKTMKKKVLVPVEENIKVPVYRKEAKRNTEKVTVKGTRLVPVTRYKEVEETVLEVQEEMINGHKEKRARPVTRIRRIPYQDFEEKIVDVEVEVPADQVVQRQGFRVDKHVVSKVVEVEEDLVYEMRPVLVNKGEKRMKDIGEHHKFKKEHGQPVWEDAFDQWANRPKTPTYRDDLPRPRSASSIYSAASSMIVPRLKPERKHDAGMIKSAGYVPRKNYSTGSLSNAGQ